MSKRSPEKTQSVPADAPGIPRDFLWGGVLSAHCVEGDDANSDWTHWEQRPGRIAGGGFSGQAAAFHQRCKEDIPRFRNIGLNALCVSLSWARIAPGPHEFDEAALETYRRMLVQMNSAGLRPFVVLWDRALPEWFVRQGAWSSPAAVDHFQEYTTAVAGHLGTACRDWIPLWMPEIWLHQVYTPGSGPVPRGLGWRHALAVRRNLFNAWRTSCQTLRASAPECRVGVSITCGLHWPRNRYSPWDTRQARLHTTGPNWWLQGYRAAPGAHPDFVMAACRAMRRARFSLPVYMRDTVLHSALPGHAAEFDQNTFYTLMDELVPRELPVYLIVDGVADSPGGKQSQQVREIAETLEAAMKNDSFPQGLFFNPLMDGFQWTEGWSAPRGLIHVHPKTLSRTPNPAAFLLSDIIAAGGLQGIPNARRTTAQRARS